MSSIKTISSTLSKPVLLLLLTMYLLSCGKEDGPEPIHDSRTVMVYMAANNNLVNEAYRNINQMEESFQGIAGNLIVYARIFNQPPRLYQITYDDSPEIRSKVAKTYHEHNSSDPEVMKMVFDDIQALFPSESYGAILWSHATNWFPAGAVIPRTRSFGDDNGIRMDVQSLKYALPQNLDFLIFDACAMASVEVLYELRTTAPYILASPTEVLSVGMPYHLMRDYLFDKDVKKGLINVAQSYYDYYQSKQGMEQSATFSLVETTKLDNLALAVRDVLSQSAVDFSQVDRTSLQRLDFDPFASPIVAFDFLDFFEQYFPEEQYRRVLEATESAVVFKINTERFLNAPIRKFSGLSCYVPDPRESHVHGFYLGLNWVIDSEFNRLFWWR